MADLNLASSSDVIESRESIETGSEDFEPTVKRQRKEDVSEKAKIIDERLETRLGGILCCSVCLDLPSSAVYQVSFCNSFMFSFLHTWFFFLNCTICSFLHVWKAVCIEK